MTVQNQTKLNQSKSNSWEINVIELKESQNGCVNILNCIHVHTNTHKSDTIGLSIHFEQNFLCLFLTFRFYSLNLSFRFRFCLSVCHLYFACLFFLFICTCMYVRDCMKRTVHTIQLKSRFVYTNIVFD